jgi:hypothetical protein
MNGPRRALQVLGQRLHPLACRDTQHRAGTADLIPRSRLTVRNPLQDRYILCAQR